MIEPILTHKIVAKLDQNCVQVALVDYIRKIDPSIKDMKNIDYTCSQPWNFTITFEV